MPKRYTPNDKWSQKAAAEGYRARSVYKLMEIDDRFRLLKPGMSVLDLGGAPGSWAQYAAERVGPKGKVISVDLTEIQPIEGVETHVVDIKDTDALEKILPQYVGLIISDLAPKTSGIQDVDQWKSIELSQVVLDIARKHLKPNGKCVLKILRGADFDEFIRECKKEWETVKTFEARASRDRSKEIYVIIQM